MSRSRRTCDWHGRVWCELLRSCATTARRVGTSAKPGKFKDSFPTRLRSNCPSPCSDREQFTSAGDWTIEMRWIFSYILTAPKVARSWTSCKRTEFLTWLFVPQFRVLQPVRTFTSADLHIVTELTMQTTEKIAVYLLMLLLPAVANAQMSSSNALNEKQASHF